MEGLNKSSGANIIRQGWLENGWPEPEICEHFGANTDRVELSLRLGTVSVLNPESKERGKETSKEKKQSFDDRGQIHHHRGICLPAAVTSLPPRRRGPAKHRMQLSALRAYWLFLSSNPYESKLSTGRKPKTAGRLRDQLHSFLR